jgi:hypothetical protein
MLRARDECESETCLLKRLPYFFFVARTDHLGPPPNCIRIVEYEIAKTTVETNVLSLPLSRAIKYRASLAESWVSGNYHDSNQCTSNALVVTRPRATFIDHAIATLR